VRAFLFASFLISVAPTVVAAQDGLGETVAEAEFHRGEAAFVEHDFESALSHFLRAFELAPHDAVRFNIAVCYDRLGRFREAIAEYEQAAASDAIDAAAREHAREQIDLLDSRLATVRFDGWPDGAEVAIDGDARCTLPCEVREDPGNHLVLITAEGRESVERIELVRGGDHVVTAAEEERVQVLGEASVPPEEAPGWRPGWLTWTGIGLAVVGVAGSAGFGVRALDLHDQFDANPTYDLAEEGSLMRDLANVSIGVAVLGGVLFALDLLIETGGD
jgi:tetratricopeptide (TPR) repeat protein